MLRPYQRDLLKSFQELPQKELILSFKNRQLKARGVGFFTWKVTDSSETGSYFRKSNTGRYKVQDLGTIVSVHKIGGSKDPLK